jgi:hypothetical protein
LKQTLIENGESETEAESLAELDRHLRNVPEPKAHNAHKMQLLAMMKSHLPQEKSRWQRFMERYPVALLQSQLRIIQREIWFASALILMLGVLVTLRTEHPDLLSFSVLAPIVAAAGVALVYDTDMQAMLEIEETTLASARLILLARLTLVFGFNLIVALIGSVILALFDHEILLIPLIMSWLAPMTFLSGFAFFLSITGRNTLFGASMSVALWFYHLIASETHGGNPLLILLSLPGLTDPANRPYMLMGGVLLFVAALWLVGILERRTGYVQ